MLARLISYAIRGARSRGNNRAWIYGWAALAGYRALKSATQKTEIIDLTATRPGDRYLIEHLPITHKEQIKLMKAEEKAAKQAAKAEAKAAKAESKAAKAERKLSRAMARAEQS